MENQQNIVKPLLKRSHADSTREKILNAALELFAEKGFSGTSISDIAKKAQINQSLIYHHFQDKKELWRLVKTHVFENTIHAEQIEFFENLMKLDFKTFLHKIISIRFHIFLENPKMIRMINWQRLETDQREIILSPHICAKTWYRAIEHYKQTGELSREIPNVIVLNLILTGINGYFIDYYPEFATADETEKLLYLEKTIDCIYRALVTQ